MGMGTNICTEGGEEGGVEEVGDMEGGDPWEGR